MIFRSSDNEPQQSKIIYHPDSDDDVDEEDPDDDLDIWIQVIFETDKCVELLTLKVNKMKKIIRIRK